MHPQKNAIQSYQSKILDKKPFGKIASQISDFSEDDYQRLKPLILEQNIPTTQSHIQSEP
jgi:amidase